MCPYGAQSNKKLTNLYEEPNNHASTIFILLYEKSHIPKFDSVSTLIFMIP